jgi:trk system potassium uptake protein TrkH
MKFPFLPARKKRITFQIRPVRKIDRRKNGGIWVFLRCLSAIVGVVGLAMTPSLVMALAYHEEGTVIAFALPLLGSLAAAFVFLFLTRTTETRFTVYQGLLLVTLAWVFSCLLGALPFTLSGRLRGPGGFADAVYESVSGFTTTGATIFADVESLPRSILFWRAMTHWLGGMGLVVLTVALAPLLGVGAFQLNTSLEYESPGPEAGKLTPTLSSSAKTLWLIYVGLTFIQAILLMLGGMGLFDAVCTAFSTLGTGGFGNYNASLGNFSPYIKWVTAIFMILAGCNFNLYYLILRGKWRDAVEDSEGRAYFLIVCTAALVIALSLAPAQGFAAGLREGVFNTATIITTTGFSTEDINAWPALAQGVVFILMCIGGCSGSTAGGVKVIRLLILWKQTGIEVKRILYPHGVFAIILNKKEGARDVVYGVAGFVFLYAALVLAVTLRMCATGMAFFPALNTGLLHVGNIGLGLVPNMTAALDADPALVKWGLSFSMIAGRLELWTVFALFTPVAHTARLSIQRIASLGYGR